MGFEVIHQLKSNAVFFFREIPFQKCLFFFFLFRVSAFVLFRVFPCSSVANSSASVFFRVIPWLMLLLLLSQPSLTLPALNAGAEIHFLIAPLSPSI